MAGRSNGSMVALTFAWGLIAATGCAEGPETGASSAALEVRWEDDRFDDLELGPLDGQNGWASVPERGSAEVVADATGKRLRIAAATDGPVIIMGKSITPLSKSRHRLELTVVVENPLLPSLAK